MQIQWFPGHMNKARKQMAETLPKVDLLIELLDARIPYSSENPMLAELRGNKPCLKLLSKSDLADPLMTKRWRAHLELQPGVKARAITTAEPDKIRSLKSVMINMLPDKKSSGNLITTMVAGIPNVGKSTLINILAKKKVAKTGNEPAVTKSQQKINIGDGIVLLDTPGVLWPNVENQNSGFRLAVTGAIKDTAMDYDEIAWFAVGYMIQEYPERVMERYKLESMPEERLELMEQIGRKRGCLRSGGVIDLERVSRIFLTELRGGQMGRITMETPEMKQQELQELADRQQN